MRYPSAAKIIFCFPSRIVEEGSFDNGTVKILRSHEFSLNHEVKERGKRSLPGLLKNPSLHLDNADCENKNCMPPIEKVHETRNFINYNFCFILSRCFNGYDRLHSSFFAVAKARDPDYNRLNPFLLR